MQYRRVLIKLSGEALGSESELMDLVKLNRIVQEISEIMLLGVQVAIVVGGGNFFRGSSLSEKGVARTVADTVGRVATVMNALVLADVFEQQSISADVFSPSPMEGCEQYHVTKVLRAMQNGHVVIFAGGEGHGLVSTDAAASLRAIEIDADLLLKATKVDGVYDLDPVKNKRAKRFDRLTFSEAIDNQFAVMDTEAFERCQRYGVPVCVFDLNKPRSLWKILQGEQEGTYIR